MNITRRTALAIAGGLAPNLTPLHASPTALWQRAAAAGLHFGSASDVEIATAAPGYATLFGANCSLLAPNMGWHRTNPDSADSPAWEDPNIGFARAHGMRLTGGHLLWHRALPAAFHAAEGAAAADLVNRHVRAMARHYAGQVLSWNVVNEAIDVPSGTPAGQRRSPLWTKLGPNYIANAFFVAREADPRALLAYNETRLEMDTPDEEARRRALLRLLDDLLHAGAPIGAVGLQTHLRLDGSRFEFGRYRTFLSEIASRGLRILITEFDVSDIALSGSPSERDGAVAALYRDALSVILDEPAVASIVTWGLSDRYTWLTPHSDPAYRRADGTPARPLPFDAAMQPKPAYYALAAALDAAKPRERA